MAALAFVLGLILGAAGVWLLVRTRLSKTQAGKLSAEQDATVARAELESERRAHDAQIKQLEKAADEKVALVSGTREDFRTELKAIGADAAKEASEAAKESRAADREAARAELKAQASEVEKLLGPIGKDLGHLQAGLKELQEDRKKTEGQVGQMFETVTKVVGQLDMRTGQLVSALKRPNVRGTWGEMQLKNVVKAANMTERVDFHSQETIEGDVDDGRLRPDMIVHLPTERDVVVDSKVPLDAYLAAVEAPEGDERDAHLDRHAKQLKTHIDKLASKGYDAYLETPAEFVVCFLPNEAVYSAALDRDPTLLEHGALKGVLIATPATLLALLYACGYGWKQAAVEESAREIAEAGRLLHKRFGKVLGLLDNFARRFSSTVDAWDEVVGSIKGRLIPQLRRMEESGADSGQQLKAPRRVDAKPRLLASPSEIDDEDEEGDEGREHSEAA